MYSKLPFHRITRFRNVEANHQDISRPFPARMSGHNDLLVIRCDNLCLDPDLATGSSDLIVVIVTQDIAGDCRRLQEIAGDCRLAVWEECLSHQYTNASSSCLIQISVPCHWTNMQHGHLCLQQLAQIQYLHNWYDILVVIEVIWIHMDSYGLLSSQSMPCSTHVPLCNSATSRQSGKHPVTLNTIGSGFLSPACA